MVFKILFTNIFTLSLLVLLHIWLAADLTQGDLENKGTVDNVLEVESVLLAWLDSGKNQPHTMILTLVGTF